MRINSFKAWLYPICVVTAMLFSAGCTSDPPGDAGLGVLPDQDLIGVIFTDTSTIEIETRWLDRVTTGYTNVQLFGNYADPEFGRLDAVTYTQLELPGLDIDFGDPNDVEFEQISLHLDMLSHYGQLESQQTLRVFELAERLPDSSSLTSDHPPLATSGPELSGGYVIDFSSRSEVQDLVIPLDKSLGERILYADTSDLRNDAAFQNFFKGLSIGTEKVRYLVREPGAIFQLFLNSSSSFLRLNYLRRDSTGAFTLRDSIDFFISEDARKFHTIHRTEFNDVLLGQEANIPTGQPRNYEFIQAGGYLKIFVNFPHLDEMPLVGVNRAELILKADGQFFGSGNRYAPPSRIRMLIADEKGQEALSAAGNFIVNTEATYNLDEKEYRFTLTGYAQEVISNRRENYGFILVPLDTAVSVNRVVLGGLAHPMLKPVMNLTYTTLPR